MSHSRDESRSPSPDGAASPRNTHRPRSRSLSPNGTTSPRKTQHRPRSRSPSLHGTASPRTTQNRPRSRSPSPHGTTSPRNTLHRPRSRSPSPHVAASPRNTQHRPRSRSKSLPRRSRSRSVDASNPGNNLYVTGLSTRVTSSDLERFFSKEGKVRECSLVTDPHTKESRGFAFISMETVEGAERCLKYLNRSVLEGRLITVEKAKRARGRTPTPGRYQGLRDKRERPGPRPGLRRSPVRLHAQPRSFSPHRRYDRDPYPRDRRERPRSPYGRRPDYHYDSHRRGRDLPSSARRGGYP